MNRLVAAKGSEGNERYLRKLESPRITQCSVLVLLAICMYTTIVQITYDGRRRLGEGDYTKQEIESGRGVITLLVTMGISHPPSLGRLQWVAKAVCRVIGGYTK